MPPYLGQGACSGMRDGINIGWKVDLILRGLADDSLLDTVEAERKPHVTTITHNAIMLGKIANEHDPERARERDEKLRMAPPSIPLTPNVLGGLIAAGTALAGTIWPQGNIGFNGETGRFDTVIGNGFVLLANTSATGALGAARLHALRKLDCHIVAIDDPRFQDLDGVYGTYFSENGIAAFIGRPDFVVFGSVAQLDSLPDLVDRLLDGLQRPRARRWRHSLGHRRRAGSSAGCRRLPAGSRLGLRIGRGRRACAAPVAQRHAARDRQHARADGMSRRGVGHEIHRRYHARWTRPPTKLSGSSRRQSSSACKGILTGSGHQQRPCASAIAPAWRHVPALGLADRR